MKDRVKMLLKKKGITAKELASNMGISEAALSLSINGNPTLSRLQQLADGLGVELGELFVGTKDSEVLSCPKCGAKLKLVEYVEGNPAQDENEANEKEATE